jgi:hypothetical protein
LHRQADGTQSRFGSFEVDVKVTNAVKYAVVGRKIPTAAFIYSGTAPTAPSYTAVLH